MQFGYDSIDFELMEPQMGLRAFLLNYLHPYFALYFVA